MKYTKLKIVINAKYLNPNPNPPLVDQAALRTCEYLRKNFYQFNKFLAEYATKLFYLHIFHYKKQYYAFYHCLRNNSIPRLDPLKGGLCYKRLLVNNNIYLE